MFSTRPNAASIRSNYLARNECLGPRCIAQCTTRRLLLILVNPPHNRDREELGMFIQCKARIFDKARTSFCFCRANMENRIFH